MTLPAFRLARPDTLEEALGLLSEERVPYCGGTELLLAMKVGLHRPETLVDVKRVPQLRGVSRVGDDVVIGAAATHSELARDRTVLGLLPMLADVERRVGNARVRAQGSIGGNLCFAEPKSDVATALVALGASVTLASSAGQRVLAVSDLIAGAYYADKEPDELLVDVRVPVGRNRRGTYLKYQVTERPTVGVAVVEDVASGACRVVVGAVGETPVTHEAASLSAVDVDAITSEVDPVEDLTGSATYKRHVTGVFVRRAVAALRGGGDDH
jgi:carbon-monoxide dehydrogenase medium subunit